MRVFIFLTFLFSFSNAMDFMVFPVTSNASFNYFFSFPVWISLLTAPMLFVFFVLRHLK